MTVEALAAKMIRLFDGGRGWAQHTFAATAKGSPTNMDDPEATRFCLIGAGNRLLSDVKDFQRTRAWREFRERLGRVAGLFERDHHPDGYALMTWNDSRHSYGEVEAALRAVIEGGK